MNFNLICNVLYSYIYPTRCNVTQFILSGNCSTCFGWYHIIFNVHWSVHGKNILIYVQQDATLHNLFYLETALHVSVGTTTHHQERKQLYLQHLLFVTPLLLPATIAAGSSNGVTNTRCCRYSCLRS